MRLIYLPAFIISSHSNKNISFKKREKLTFFWVISHLMTKNLDKEGFKAIVENYDFFFIDLWGVIHNGIRLNENAIKTLIEISNTKKTCGKGK